MDNVTEDCGAFGEAVVFLNHFKDLSDHCQPGMVMYPHDEVLLLALLAVLAGAESFVDTARFGRMKMELLRRFQPSLCGTPSHDHLGDIFAALDAEQFQRCFAAWVSSLLGAPAGMVAIDGRTVRRSGGKAGKGAIHMVSAFAAASASCSDRSRWPNNPTRPSRSRSFWTCWRSKERSSPSTRWAASVPSLRRS